MHSLEKNDGRDTADRWLTGIVEVALPVDFRIANIEALHKLGLPGLTAVGRCMGCPNCTDGSTAAVEALKGTPNVPIFTGNREGEGGNPREAETQRVRPRNRLLPLACKQR